MGEQEPQNTIYDPVLGGTWLGPADCPAIPWDIGGTNPDGTFRPGTVLLEDGPLTPKGTILPENAALGGIAAAIAPDQQNGKININACRDFTNA